MKNETVSTSQPGALPTTDEASMAGSKAGHCVPGPPQVCIALPGQATRLNAMLVRAFDEDPLTCWFVRGDERRPRRMQRLFDWYLRQALPLGWSHATEDGSCAALWMGPGQWKMPLLRQLLLLPELIRVVGADRLVSRIRGTDALQHRHPRAPHFYLAVLGAEPLRQGQGLGSSVLRQGLQRCDRMRVPAYLETANPRNLALYKRHDFEVRERLTIPGGGPPVWLMWRPARP